MSKSIKKILTASVVALLLCSPTVTRYNKTLTASAANTLPVTFPDVNPYDWFAKDIKRLTEANIISGYPDGNFHPELEITVAEFVKILVLSVPSLTVHGTVRLYPDHWASEFLTAAYEAGIITDADLNENFNPNSLITRASMTKMVVLALGIDTFYIETPFTDTADIYAATAYNEYLLRGYLQPDGTRICNGNNHAKRSEAVSIAVRVIEYRSNPYEFKKKAILENASNNILHSEHELIDLFYVLNREFMTEFTFRTSQTTLSLRKYCERSNVINLEYFYNAFTKISPLGNGHYRVAIEYLPDVNTVRNYHAEAVKAADLIISTQITSGMGIAERVKTLHDYLVLNCEYDIENYKLGNIPQESRLAYGALVNKKAVCQGYCAAFSLLCERAGVDKCIVVGGNAPNSRDSHSWNVVLIDGIRYFIDTTHDDPIPDRKGIVSHRYFCLIEDEMISYGYSWDKSSSELKYFY